MNRCAVVWKGKVLRRVLFDLKPQWEEEALLLKDNLAGDGLACASFTQADLESQNAWKQGAVVLTDSPETGKKLADKEILYFGCRRPDSCAWFDGAVLVLEGFEEVDARYLEEWMLRAQGLPAVIAQTECLEIREMTERDLPDLVRIGRQNRGAALAADVFSYEWLSAYIKTAYRLQGFGLWSVLHQGRVIGCCGFAPWGEKRTAERVVDEMVPMKADETYRTFLLRLSDSGEKISLEMQYMLDRAWQRRGFGTQMCLAALEYARDRLGAEEIYLRIRPGNRASLALAEKLHFTGG